MHTHFERVQQLLWVALLLILPSCAFSERKAADRIDSTLDIIQQASDLLAADPELSRLPIVVDGFREDMRLRGTVATPAQKTRAAKIVWAVRSVRSLENDLHVSGGPETK